MRDRGTGKPIERLRERLAHVGEDGWFFAQLAEQVAERRRRTTRKGA